MNVQLIITSVKNKSILKVSFERVLRVTIYEHILLFKEHSDG